MTIKGKNAFATWEGAVRSGERNTGGSARGRALRLHDVGSGIRAECGKRGLRLEAGRCEGVAGVVPYHFETGRLADRRVPGAPYDEVGARRYLILRVRRLARAPNENILVMRCSATLKAGEEERTRTGCSRRETVRYILEFNQVSWRMTWS